jgi:hypothetical protein
MTFYACSDDTITIPWTYILGSGDSIGEISWIYHGHSEEIIAIYTHGAFVPLPAFRYDDHTWPATRPTQFLPTASGFTERSN